MCKYFIRKLKPKIEQRIARNLVQATVADALREVNCAKRQIYDKDKVVVQVNHRVAGNLPDLS